MLPPTPMLTVIEPGRAGLGMNPLQIQPAEHLGPLGPAIRVSGILARWCGFDHVHRNLLLNIIVDAYERAGITSWDTSTWQRTPPTLREVRDLLDTYVQEVETARHDIARTLQAHLDMVGTYGLFRPDGAVLSWSRYFEGAEPSVVLLQLHGLDPTSRGIIIDTIFADCHGYLRQVRPQQSTLYCLVDGAYNLSFGEDSPVDLILRDASQSGVGLVLTAQSIDDVGPVALARIPAKVIFRSDGGTHIDLDQALSLQYPRLGTADEVASATLKLRRGSALYLHRDKEEFINIPEFRS